jgi:hypothetical protein
LYYIPNRIGVPGGIVKNLAERGYAAFAGFDDGPSFTYLTNYRAFYGLLTGLMRKIEAGRTRLTARIGF